MTTPEVRTQYDPSFGIQCRPIQISDNPHHSFNSSETRCCPPQTCRRMRTILFPNRRQIFFPTKRTISTHPRPSTAPASPLHPLLLSEKVNPHAIPQNDIYSLSENSNVIFPPTEHTDAVFRSPPFPIVNEDLQPSNTVSASEQSDIFHSLHSPKTCYVSKISNFVSYNAHTVRRISKSSETICHLLQASVTEYGTLQPIATLCHKSQHSSSMCSPPASGPNLCPAVTNNACFPMQHDRNIPPCTQEVGGVYYQPHDTVMAHERGFYHYTPSCISFNQITDSLYHQPSDLSFQSQSGNICLAPHLHSSFSHSSLPVNELHSSNSNWRDLYPVDNPFVYSFPSSTNCRRVRFSDAICRHSKFDNTSCAKNIMKLCRSSKSVHTCRPSYSSHSCVSSHTSVTSRESHTSNASCPSRISNIVCQTTEQRALPSYPRNKMYNHQEMSADEFDLPLQIDEPICSARLSDDAICDDGNCEASQSNVDIYQFHGTPGYIPKPPCSAPCSGKVFEPSQLLGYNNRSYQYYGNTTRTSKSRRKICMPAQATEKKYYSHGYSEKRNHSAKLSSNTSNRSDKMNYSTKPSDVSYASRSGTRIKKFQKCPPPEKICFSLKDYDIVNSSQSSENVSPPSQAPRKTKRVVQVTGRFSSSSQPAKMRSPKVSCNSCQPCKSSEKMKMKPEPPCKNSLQPKGSGRICLQIESCPKKVSGENNLYSTNKCPVTENIRQTSKNICPATEKICPATENPYPATENICPVTKTICPANKYICPVTKTICPANKNIGPANKNICPANKNICPANKNICPANKNICPANKNIYPANKNICPANQNICPANKNVCPNSKNVCPATGNVCPKTGNVCPAAGNVSPKTGNVCPAAGNVCPAAGNVCPAAGNVCPATGSVCPATGSVCPSSGNVCPATANVCPTSGNVCPASGNVGPATGNVCPSTGSVCPSTGNVCPSTGNVCPSTGSVCPSTANAGPASGNVCPATANVCPATENVCPATGNVCPSTENVCPSTANTCPATSSPSGTVIHQSNPCRTKQADPSHMSTDNPIASKRSFNIYCRQSSEKIVCNCSSQTTDNVTCDCLSHHSGDKSCNCPSRTAGTTRGSSPSAKTNYYSQNSGNIVCRSQTPGKQVCNSASQTIGNITCDCQSHVSGDKACSCPSRAAGKTSQNSACIGRNFSRSASCEKLVNNSASQTIGNITCECHSPLSDDIACSCPSRVAGKMGGNLSPSGKTRLSPPTTGNTCSQYFGNTSDDICPSDSSQKIVCSCSSQTTSNINFECPSRVSDDKTCKCPPAKTCETDRKLSTAGKNNYMLAPSGDSGRYSENLGNIDRKICNSEASTKNICKCPSQVITCECPSHFSDDIPCKCPTRASGNVCPNLSPTGKNNRMVPTPDNTHQSQYSANISRHFPTSSNISYHSPSASRTSSPQGNISFRLPQSSATCQSSQLSYNTYQPNINIQTSETQCPRKISVCSFPRDSPCICPSPISSNTSCECGPRTSEVCPADLALRGKSSSSGKSARLHPTVKLTPSESTNYPSSSFGNVSHSSSPGNITRRPASSGNSRHTLKYSGNTNQQSQICRKVIHPTQPSEKICTTIRQHSSQRCQRQSFVERNCTPQSSQHVFNPPQVIIKPTPATQNSGILKPPNKNTRSSQQSPNICPSQSGGICPSQTSSEKCPSVCSGIGSGYTLNVPQHSGNNPHPPSGNVTFSSPRSSNVASTSPRSGNTVCLSQHSGNATCPSQRSGNIPCSSQRVGKTSCPAQQTPGIICPQPQTCNQNCPGKIQCPSQFPANVSCPTQFSDHAMSFLSSNPSENAICPSKISEHIICPSDNSDLLVCTSENSCYGNNSDDNTSTTLPTPSNINIRRRTCDGIAAKRSNSPTFRCATILNRANVSSKISISVKKTKVPRNTQTSSTSDTKFTDAASQSCPLSVFQPCQLSESQPSQLSESKPCQLSESKPCQLSESKPCQLSEPQACQLSEPQACLLAEYEPCQFTEYQPCQLSEYQNCALSDIISNSSENIENGLEAGEDNDTMCYSLKISGKPRWDVFSTRKHVASSSLANSSSNNSVLDTVCSSSDTSERSRPLPQPCGITIYPSNFSGKDTRSSSPNGNSRNSSPRVHSSPPSPLGSRGGNRLNDSSPDPSYSPSRLSERPASHSIHSHKSISRSQSPENVNRGVPYRSPLASCHSSLVSHPSKESPANLQQDTLSPHTPSPKRSASEISSSRRDTKRR